MEGALEEHYISESDLNRKIREKDDSINTLNQHLAILRFEVNSVNDNPFIQNNKKFEFQRWNSEKAIQYLENERKKIDESIKKSNLNAKKSQLRSDSLNAKLRIMNIK